MQHIGFDHVPDPVARATGLSNEVVDADDCPRMPAGDELFERGTQPSPPLVEFVGIEPARQLLRLEPSCQSEHEGRGAGSELRNLLDVGGVPEFAKSRSQRLRRSELVFPEADALVIAAFFGQPNEGTPTRLPPLVNARRHNCPIALS